MWRKRFSMWSKRLALFFCFMLSGILLDAYATWYSYHFAAECSESGNMVPPTYFLFAIMSAIPATVSITLGTNLTYIFICGGAWLFYIVFCLLGIEQLSTTEGRFGVNCYRDVGSGVAVLFLFTAIFSAIIIAITVAFGAVALARKSFR
jgi:hypothetical protein